MVIQFLLPGAGIAGGIKVVYQYANHLQRQGHAVRIYYPGVLNPPKNYLWPVEHRVRSAKYWLKRKQGKNEATDWFPLETPIFHVPSLEARFIPPADITVATSNETADFVASLPSDRGEKFYFIQDVELWGRDPEEVWNTWRLPLRKITISNHLRTVAEEIGESVEAVVVNGVDTSIFYNDHKVFNQPRRLLMMSHKDPRKAIEDGFAAVRLVRERYPDTILRMFGAQTPRPDMPSETEYIQAPTPKQLRELYSTSDIFIYPSEAEGFGLPPMEAMGCGTAVVATNVGGIPDYTVAGKTALIVPPHQPNMLAESVLTLLDDEKLLASISAAGQKHIGQFTLDRAEAAFEKALLAPRPHVIA